MTGKEILSDSDEYTDAHDEFVDCTDKNSDKSDWECEFNEKLNISSSGNSSPVFEETSTSGTGHQNHASADNSEEERRKSEEKLTSEELEERRSESLSIKQRGNELFQAGEYHEAIEEYTKALELCPLLYEKDRSILLSNRSACHHKQGNIDAALIDCDEALKLHPDYVKCLQRRAGLREERDMLTDALKDYEKLVQLDPSNQKARWACMTLPDRIKKQQEEMKEKMLDQLKQLGNMVLKPFGLSTDNFKVEKKPGSEGYSINFVR